MAFHVYDGIRGRCHLVEKIFFSGFRLVNTKCMVLVDMWKKIQHSNIVTLREVFTTKAFAEPCE